MRVLGVILVAGIVLNLLQALATVLIIGLLLALVIGVCMRPRHTFGLLTFMLLIRLLEVYPAAVLGMLALTIVGSTRRLNEKLRQPDGQERELLSITYTPPS